MANKTNTLTNTQAIAKAVETLTTLGCEDRELLEKLEHMHKVASKNRPSSESPEAKEMREVLIPATIAFMKEKGKPVAWRDVCKNVRGVRTRQKATSIMRKLVVSGTVEKEYNGRATVYRLA